MNWVFRFQYPSNTPKCTNFDPYWMQNNIFFDIPFCMHNNLNMVKILGTIYLLLAVLFLFVPSYWHLESWVYETRKFVHDTAKTGSTSNLCFSATIRPLRKIFNCIIFYTSAQSEIAIFRRFDQENLKNRDKCDFIPISRP